MKKTISLLLIGLFSLPFCQAQNLTGIWKGFFITKDRSQYRIELQVKAQGQQLTGVSYSYLDTVYYGKASLTGHYDKESRRYVMQEIKTLEVKSSEGSVTCLMKYLLQFNQSGNEKFLEGSYTSIYETNGVKAKKGADCGGGTVFLRRVADSDFYTESFLQNKGAAKKVIFNQAPVAKKTGSSNTPSSYTGPKKNSQPIAVKNNEKSNPVPAAIQTETTKATADTDAPAKPARTAPSPVFNNRQNELVREMIIPTAEISIALYDNGEIDGDTISVFLNGKMALYKKRLGSVPLQLKMPVDDSKDFMEITVVAENLGRIPPNTALMIVDVGEQQYRLQVLSDDKKNAVFRFRYEHSR